jgi:diguanylate cyclase (GGDEF)-like protein
VRLTQSSRLLSRTAATGATRVDQRRLVAGFYARLGASIVVTFSLLSAAGYVLIGEQLERRRIDGFGIEHAAEAQTLATTAKRTVDGAEAINQLHELVTAFAAQPGVREMLVIDERGVVRIAADMSLVGTRVRDRRVDAALRRAESFTGRSNSGERLVELIAPLDLPAGRTAFASRRFAFVARRDARRLDETLATLRRTLVIVAVLAMVSGSAMFWLVGGRQLLHSHRIALQRADRDGLTDLPNHRAFREALMRDIGVATRHDEPLALALIDLDDFKFINDRHGHPHGDALLRRVSAALRGVRIGDRAYRLGGDEFALLLPRANPAGARAVAVRLRRALGDAGISASIGLGALTAGQEGDALLAEADAALYDAKRRGGRGIVHFEDVTGQVAVTTPEEMRAVRRLLDEGDVTTAFQPIWDLTRGTLLGVEALARPASGYGLQGPAHAFDLAEQVGRVRELDALCVRSALRAAATLPPEALLFINLSPQTLDLDADDDWLLRAVTAAGLSPARIVLEVTERFGARTTTVVRTLHRLRAQGFKLALDDVGTGNAGLEMLRAVGAEFVKIDRSIVADAPSEPNARAVLLAMATFARQTGAFVIAEGIEDDELLRYVSTLDERLPGPGAAIIQGGQGYGLGRPAADPPVAGTRLDGLAAPAAIA